MSARDSLLRYVCGEDDPHIAQLVDAYRAEVLAADGQAYTGELTMLRHLIETLTAAAITGDLTAIQQALTHHAVDDKAARAAAGVGFTVMCTGPGCRATAPLSVAAKAWPRTRGDHWRCPNCGTGEAL